MIFMSTSAIDKDESLENITIQRYNEELMEAEAEFERGEYITNEVMMKLVKEWKGN